MNSIQQRANLWITGSDTGISSKAIWKMMMASATSDRHSHPSDPSDFGRCYRLLKLIPEWREQIDKMAAVSPYWAALVERWANIEALYEEEKSGASAPKTYALMRSILKDIEAKDKSVIRFGDIMGNAQRSAETL